MSKPRTLPTWLTLALLGGSAGMCADARPAGGALLPEVLPTPLSGLHLGMTEEELLGLRPQAVKDDFAGYADDWTWYSEELQGDEFFTSASYRLGGGRLRMVVLSNAEPADVQGKRTALLRRLRERWGDPDRSFIRLVQRQRLLRLPGLAWERQGEFGVATFSPSQDESGQPFNPEASLYIPTFLEVIVFSGEWRDLEQVVNEEATSSLDSQAQANLFGDVQAAGMRLPEVQG